MRARSTWALVGAGLVIAATAAAQPAAPTMAPRPRAAPPAAAPQTPGGGETPPVTRLGRPFPAPVQPPQPAAQPGIHVGVVSPSESRFSNRLRGGRSRMDSHRRSDRTGAAMD